MPSVAGPSTQRGPLPRQGHQGLCQICKIFNKSAVISDKANELSDTFDLIRGMPVLYYRQLRGAMPVRPTICPKKTTSVCMKVHFLAFSCKPKLLRRHSTPSRRPRASVTVPPNEITSSKYTKHRDQRIPHKTWSISLSNVAGALHSPNGITRNWNNPSFVTNAALRLASGDMATCQYPLARSMVENHCWFRNKRNESLIRGKG